MGLTLFTNNIYNLLGLSIYAENKDILKRVNEIINYLKINNIPKYNLDIDDDLYSIRNEKNVYDILNKIKDPKKKLKDIFFWFDILDDIDKKSIFLIKNKDFKNALNNWKDQINKKNIDDLSKCRYKKNIALLYIYIMQKFNDYSLLNDSFLLWSDIINDDIFWYNIKEHYSKIDLIFNDNIFNYLVDNIKIFLSDFFADISFLNNNNIYISSFYKEFHIIGEVAKNKVLKPIYDIIYKDIDILNEINDDNNDNSLNVVKNIQKVKSIIDDFINFLDTLKSMNMDNLSDVILIKDQFSSLILKVSVKFYNKYNKIEESIDFLTKSLNLAATDSTKETLKEELDKLILIKKNNEIIDNIINLVLKKEYKKALSIIDDNFDYFKNNEFILNVLNNQINICLSNIIKNEYDKIKDGLNNKSIYKIKAKIDDLFNFIQKYINFLNVDKNYLNNLLNDFLSNLDKQKILFFNINHNSLNIIYNYFNKIQNDFENQKLDNKELLIVVYKVYILYNFLSYLDNKKKIFFNKFSWLFPENLLIFFSNFFYILFLISLFLLLSSILIISFYLFMYVFLTILYHEIYPFFLDFYSFIKYYFFY